MKCPACLFLNTADDDYCMSCGSLLDRAGLILRAQKSERVRNTPGWAYFFATLCGLVPVATLGGVIPIGIGIGGVAGCLALGRFTSAPTSLRVFTCILIVIACWFGTYLVLGVLATALRH